jgi:outer membrane receptor protein involved in Fe transport
VGITADAGRAGYSSGTELAILTPDRGTEGLGIELLDDRIRVDSRTSTAALFGLETLSLDARTTLSLSARWQRSDERLLDRLGTALNGNHTFQRVAPAIGLTRALAGRWTLFGNYGVSSRVPTPVELTCADPQDPCRLPNAFVSDPPLREVVTRTAELGTRAGWGGVDISAAVFRADSRDDILFISSGSLTGSGHFANVGRTQRDGVELLARGRLAHEATWFVTYSFLNATFQTAFTAPAPNHPDAVDGSLPVRAGDRLPLVPAHTAKAGFEVPLGRARLAASLLHVSARFLRGDEANLLSPLAAYTRVDTSVSYPFGHGIRGFLEAQNLLNEKYETFGLLGDPGAVLGEGENDPRFLSPGSPRTFIAGVRFGAGE